MITIDSLFEIALTLEIVLFIELCFVTLLIKYIKEHPIKLCCYSIHIIISLIMLIIATTHCVEVLSLTTKTYLCKSDITIINSTHYQHHYTDGNHFIYSTQYLTPDIKPHCTTTPCWYNGSVLSNTPIPYIWYFIRCITLLVVSMLASFKTLLLSLE